jgi:hypothetical protein
VAPHSPDFERVALEADLVAFERDRTLEIDEIDPHDGLDDLAEPAE